MKPDQGYQAKPDSDKPKSWIPYLDSTRALMDKFDAPFVVLLGVQNINHGLWSVAVLAC